MKDIIEQNRGLIKAIIKKLTGSYNEDIEQEVYIKTWRNMDHYKEQGKFSQWIGALTANVCRDYFKSRQYKIEAGQVGGDEILQRQILKAVDELPRKMRQVVVWYEFEEMSYDQIAAKTGEPVGTIKSRLFNARKTLSEKLQHLKGDR